MAYHGGHLSRMHSRLHGIIQIIWLDSTI